MWRKNARENVITDEQGRTLSDGMPGYPIVGLGSAILGLILVLRPEIVVDVMSYILGAILVLDCIGTGIYKINQGIFSGLVPQTLVNNLVSQQGIG